MQSDMLIREMVESRGASYRSVSAAMGKSPEWARNSAMPGRSPQIATIAGVADALGYAVQIVNVETGAVFATVEPPERG